MAVMRNMLVVALPLILASSLLLVCGSHLVDEPRSLSYG